MDNEKMIQCIDQYLRSSKLEVIGVQEAVNVLKEEKLYNGGVKSFRERLRKGLMPHAYQAEGDGSRWFIPRSSNVKNVSRGRKGGESVVANVHESTKEKVQKASDPVLTTEQAREKYKPAEVKYLLVAEAPPASVDRFFYYEDVGTNDGLFVGIIEAIQGKQSKIDYLAEGREKEMKKSFLKHFQAKGFYLLDCSNDPFPKNWDSVKRTKQLHLQATTLQNRIKELVGAKTKIILIKATVFDAVYSALATEFPGQVICSRIPFPGSGQQKKFQRKFKKALKKAEYKN